MASRATASRTAGKLKGTLSKSATGPSPSRPDKRPITDVPEASEDERSSKLRKKEDAGSSKPTVHPFFQKGGPTTTFRWLSWVGGTCRHGIHLSPKATPKVAAFDLDGTLIKTKSGNTFAKDFSDWKWWGEGNTVPQKLQSLHEEGYAIVIVTNQAIPGNIKDSKKREARLANFEKKLHLISAKLAEVPFRLFAATEKDMYRKPAPGTWFELERVFQESEVEINLKESFYVGDAGGRSGDHHISDRLYALNIGLPFFTPEEFFMNHRPKPFTLKGFNPSSLPVDVDKPLFTPMSTPIIPPNPTKPEIVVFVGYPAVGKTSFYKKYFAPAGYIHVNQDTLKSKPNCLKAVRQAVESGSSCVVDNTNRDLATRADYHGISKELNVPIRAFWFNVNLDLAWHINIYRAFCLADDVREREGARTIVPYNAFTGFQNAFQMPTIEEGFSEVKTINWIFDGSDEDQRRFHMYLDVF